MRHVITWNLLVLPTLLFGQSAVLSQYQLIPTYDNPSAIGANSGYRIAYSNRTQWTALQVPYQNNFFSFDAKKGDKLGLGLKSFNHLEGDGRMRSRGILLATAFHSYFQPGRKRAANKLLNFHIGAEAGLIQRNIDLSGLIFSDQTDPALGVVASQSGASVIGGNYSGLLINFGAGINGIWGGSQKSIWYLGFAANNLGRYSRSFTHNFEVLSNPTLMARASLACNVYDMVGPTMKSKALREHYLIFSYRYANQASFRSVHDINTVYTYKHFIGGLGYRNTMLMTYKDEYLHRGFAVAQVGFSFIPENKIATQIVYSYDLGMNQTPGLAGHTHEISISLYNSSFGKKPRPGMNNCHDLMGKNVLPIW